MKFSYSSLLLGLSVSFGCSQTSQGGREKDPCTTDEDCSDQRFCNGIEVCDHNAFGADTRGCVLAVQVPECDDHVECTLDSCSNELESCVHAARDNDADGHKDARCESSDGQAAGDDCDDEDSARYPGHSEICDGVDNDCDPRTTDPSSCAEVGGSGGRAFGGAMSGDGGSGGASGGVAGEAGGTAGAGGDAGGGGTVGAAAAISGRVVDFFLHPIGDVPVTIVDVGTTVTDSAGRFTFEAVPNAFDVEFWVTGGGASYLYRFEGVSRRDPILQASIRGKWQAGDVVGTYENMPDGADRATPAFASPASVNIPSRSSGSRYGVSWVGSPSLSTTVHLLHWEPSTPDTEPAYYAHAYKGVTVQEANVSLFTVGNWLSIDDSDVVSGSVSQTGAELFVYLRFDDGAVIELFDETLSSAAFDFLTPVIDSSGITVCAKDPDVPGIALAHTTILPGQTAPQLDIPEPAVPIAPNTNLGGAGPDTQLSWSPGSASPCSLIIIESTTTLSGARIATCEANTMLLRSLSLSAGEEYSWRIETHGAHQTMDEITSGNGFMDSMSLNGGDAPAGTSTAAGTFATSQTRTFVTAP